MKTILFLALLILFQCSNSHHKNTHNFNTIIMPDLKINNTNGHKIEKAYRIALGDVFSNIQLHQSGILTEEKPCLLAGLLYDRPWTRDAAINVWNGFGLLFPEIAKNTLLAQIGNNEKNEKIIIGQYWDKIIWALGAWQYYLYTDDKDFLKLSFNTIINTLKYLEQEEFSADKNLFRGPAVYGDGVAAYPEIYTQYQDKTKTGSYSCILDWVTGNPDSKAADGFGLPMHALSTNCVYFRAYSLLPQIAEELNIAINPVWTNKATNLKTAINTYFWNETTRTYKYLIDPFGGSDVQESLGLSFAILFGIADSDQIDSIFKNTTIEPTGIPCVFPSFKRYINKKLDSYGRHSGTIWPHIQGFWADAAKKNNQFRKFSHEFYTLTTHAVRDMQFVEIYHPKTGLPYGGIQEPSHKSWQEWFCADRQSWSATAFIRMIFMDIIGMNFTTSGIEFEPYMPNDLTELKLQNLKYQNAILNIHIIGNGNKITSFKLNNNEIKSSINRNLIGVNNIEITLLNDTQ